jgi:putative hydrolase of the HAD superfamily
MIKVVIFDIGGVLVTNSYIPLLHQIADENNLSFEEIKDFASPFFYQVMIGETTEVELFERISQQFGLAKNGEELDVDIGKLFQPIEETWELVKQLKPNYRLAILSDLGHGWIERHEREFVISKYFDELFYSAQLGMQKPDSKIYQHMLDTMNVVAEECVFIDDKPSNIEAARALGIKGIIYENPEQLKRELKQFGV